MSYVDFDHIQMLPDESALFDRLCRSERLTGNEPGFNALARLGFVSFVGCERNGTFGYKSGWYVISDTGRRYMAYQDRKARKQSLARRRFIFTTVIAVLTLLSTIISIVVTLSK